MARKQTKVQNEETLIQDLWWFIENVNEDTADRTARFFALRERVRDWGSRGAQYSALDAVTEVAAATISKQCVTCGQQTCRRFLVAGKKVAACIPEHARVDAKRAEVIGDVLAAANGVVDEWSGSNLVRAVRALDEALQAAGERRQG